MTIKQYAEKVKKSIDEKGIKVNLIEVEKVNGVVLTGFTYSGKTISPTIYIDDLFRDNVDVDETADFVIKSLEKYLKPDGSMGEFIKKITEGGLISDYGKVRPLLKARLYNKKTKADIYMSAEKFGFPDLIVVPHIVFDLDEDGACGSVKVTRSQFELWGVDEETVLKDSIDNVDDAVILRIEDVLPIPMELNFTMLVVSNKYKCFGAISILSAFDRLMRVFPDGFVVLPSSIHEVLVAPIFKNHLNDYGDLIQLVNSENLKPEEILGDKPYVFYPA